MNLPVPTHIRLEATSACQLRCPLCPTARGEVHAGAAGKGYLEYENFRRFLELNPGVSRIELSNYGEALLNPDLVEILALAQEKGVSITLSNGTNMNHATDELLEALVRYKVRLVTVSIDGATRECYEIYRVRGNLDAVLDNIRKINRYKQKYQSALPVLAWQFVVFGHNKHEISRAREMARELKMMFLIKENWDPAYSPDNSGRDTNTTPASTESPLPSNSAPEFKQSPCSQLWLSPQVNWDGKILGCCVNYWHDIGGNAFEQPASEWFRGEGLSSARAIVQGHTRLVRSSPCQACDIYRNMKSANRFIKVPDKPGCSG